MIRCLRFAIALCLVTVCTQLMYGQSTTLVINEVNYDGGTSAGQDDLEFVEIKNISGGTINLDVYEIALMEDNSGPFAYEEFDLPDVDLPAGEYFVVCPFMSTVPNCDFELPDVQGNNIRNVNVIQDGGNNNGVALRKRDVSPLLIVDALNYKEDNPTGLSGGYSEGGGTTKKEPFVAGDFISLNRATDGVDTDDNEADFQLSCYTPGLPNNAEDTDCACVSPGARTAPITVTTCVDENQNTDAGICSWAGPATGAVFNDPEGCAPTVTIVRSDAAATEAPFLAGTTTVTYTASDDAGNTAVCVQTVTVTDNEVPTNGFCPNDTTIKVAPPANVTLTVPTYMDNCTDSADHSVTYTTSDPGNVPDDPNANDGNYDVSGVFPEGTTTITWTATDEEGNPAVNCVTNVTIIHPTLVINEIDYDDGGSPDSLEFIEIKNVSGGDIDMSGYSIELVADNGTGAAIYTTITIPGSTILAANDYYVICGNETTDVGTCDLQNAFVSIQNGGVNDNAVGLRDIGGVLLDAVSYEATVAGYDEGSFAVGDSEPVAFKSISRLADGQDTDDNSADFAYVCRTPGFTNSSNTTDCSCETPNQTLDNEDPTIVCNVTDLLLSTDNGNCQAILDTDTLDFTTTDNCGERDTFYARSDMSGEFPISMNTSFDVGTYVITVIVDDTAGNRAMCDVNLEVRDLVNPVITCPNDVVATDNDGNCVENVTVGSATATDNCAIGIIKNDFDDSDDASGTYPTGVTTVKWTAFDVSSNTSTCTMTVTVLDNEDPMIVTCPADVSGVADPGNNCMLAATVDPIQASDNCTNNGDLIITNDYNGTDNASDNYPIGTTTVRWTVEDQSGRTTNCNTIVTVGDNTIPTFSACPADITMVQQGPCNVSVSWVPPTASDDCGPINVVSTHNPGDLFGPGTTTVMYTVTDAVGNQANCSFDVTVSSTLTYPYVEDFDDFTNCGDNTNACVDNGSCAAALTNGWINATNDSMDWSVTDAATLTEFTGPASDHTGNGKYLFTESSSCFEKLALLESPCFDLSPMSCPSMSFWYNMRGVGNMGTLSVEIEDNDNPGTWIQLFSETGHKGTEWILAEIDLSTYFEKSVKFRFRGLTGDGARSDMAIDDFMVFNQDIVDPTVTTCPTDVTEVAPTDECEALASWTVPTFDDNCGISSVEESHMPGTLFPVGETTVVYRAFDNSGNTATCSFDVNIVDAQLPVWADCPADINVNANGANCSAVVSWDVPTVSDNCPNGLMENASHNPNTSFELGNTTVTYTAEDSYGNIALCQFNVRVEDTEAPTFLNCPIDQTVSNETDRCDATVSWTEPTADDNCNVQNVTKTHSPGDRFPQGVTTVSYFATDNFNNGGSCSFVVTVEDTQLPTITCPADIQVNTRPNICGSFVFYADVTGFDNCDNPQITLDEGLGDGSYFPIGENVEVWQIVDAGGNTVTCSFTVTVLDSIAPRWFDCPDDVFVTNEPGRCNAAADWVAPRPFDNCGVLQTSSTHNPEDTFAGGVTTVVYTVEDLFGNIGTCAFDVIVEDIEPPLFTSCPSNISVAADDQRCDTDVTWTTPVAIDNCGIENFVPSHDPGDNFPVGNTTVTYLAEDEAGNESTCVFVVTVRDDELPTLINCPTDIELDIEPGKCTAEATWNNPTGADNCGDVEIQGSHETGDDFPVGLTEVTIEALDKNGNVSQCTFEVKVNDTGNPTIVCPDDIVIETRPNLCGRLVFYDDPRADDACSATEIELIDGESSGSFLPVGEYTQVWEATDGSGNQATCTFQITVVDNSAPDIFACPNDRTVEAEEDSCSAIVNWIAPITADNCGTDSVAVNFEPGSRFPVGVETVTYEVFDESGNSSICSFVVNVVDAQIPTFDQCPADQTVGVDLGECDAEVTWQAPIFTDNCFLGDVVSSHVPGEIFRDGITEVTYTASDQAGNIAVCAFNVEVIDSEAPTVTFCPDNIEVANSLGECGANVFWELPEGEDNCGDVFLVSNAQPDDFFPIGVSNVFYEIRDSSGNAVQCQFTVTVSDTEAPVYANCPTDTVLSTDQIDCTRFYNWTRPDATDNCGVEDEDQNFLFSFGNFEAGVTTVTYTAEDEVGNVGTCSFDVTVEDRVLPIITRCPADQFSCTQDVSWAEPRVRDNCEVASFESSHNSGNIFNFGVTTVEYVAKDEAGNSATCSFDVTVYEQVVAEAGEDAVICNGEILTLGSEPLQEGLIYEWAPTTGLDNPSAPQVMANPSQSITYTLTVSDQAGCFEEEDEVTITVRPAPTVSVTANRAVCIGSSIGLGDDLSVSGVAPYTYLWEPATDLVGANTPNPSASPTEPTVYTLTVTDATGCFRTATVGVSINQLPNVVINNTSPFCVDGDVVQLSANFNGGSWSGDGIINAQNGTFDPTIGVGIYDVSYTYTNNNGCSNTAVEPIEVIALPDLMITSVSTVCITGGPIQLEANIPGGTWSGEGVNPTTGIFDPEVTGLGTVIISYSYADAAGCSDVATIQLTIDSSPAEPSVVFAGPLCSTNGVTVLMAEPAGGTWTGTGIVNTATGEFDPMVAGLGTHTVTYCMDEGNGCAACADIDIIVNQGVEIEINPVDQLCISDDVINLGPVTGAPGTYNWSGPGIVESNTDDGPFDPSVAGEGTHTIILEFTAIGGCTASDTIEIEVVKFQDVDVKVSRTTTCANSDTITLTADAPGGLWSGPGIVSRTEGAFYPQIAGEGLHIINYSINTACPGLDTILIEVLPALIVEGTVTGTSCFQGADGEIDVDVAGGSETNYTYTWSNGETDQDIVGLSAGAYTVTAMDGAGCTRERTFEVKENKIIEIITLQINHVNGNQKGSIFISLGGGAGDFIFEWSNGATTEDLRNIEAGEYTVTVTDGAGCSQTFTFTVDNVSSISQVDLATSVQIAPNPARDYMQIDLTTPIIMETNVSIIDVLGGQVVIDLGSKTSASRSEKVDVSNLASGQYVVRIVAGNEVVNRKVIIAR